MTSIFAQQWGRPLEEAGYVQTSHLLNRRWREIGISRTQRDLIIGIISYQDDPRTKTIPSIKQVAYEAGQCYETARKNIKILTAFKKDGGLGLLIPVLLKGGRIRYNMMPLRRELEKLKEQPLEIVKPAPVRPAPKPSPIVTIVPPDRDAAYQKAWQEIDEDAAADWEEIKQCIKEEVSPAAYDTWIAPTRGLYRDENEVLVIEVPSSSHQDALMGRFKAIIDRCRKLYGIASIVCRVMLAATVGV